MDVPLPYEYVPRSYQKPSWNALWRTGSTFEQPGDIKRAFLLHHRRAGKDLNVFNLMQCKIGQRVGVYAHIFPTLTEGKRVIWRGITKKGRRFLDYIPSYTQFAKQPRTGLWVTAKRDDDMSIEFSNGSIYQVLGADHPDSIRGMGIIGAIFSEYAFFKGPEVLDIVRPMLAENGGWMAVVTTPNGRNHSHALHKLAEREPDWFAETVPASVTNIPGIAEAIEADRKSGMSEEKIASEYECSYEIPVEGAFYGPQMQLMQEQGRIGNVPFDPRARVDTFLDIGVKDPCALWWGQEIGSELHIIDFEWMTGTGLPQVIEKIQEKQVERGFVYNRHYAPFDMNVREWGSDHAATRLGTAKALGMKFKVVPKRDLEDGRNAVRSRLATTFIDEDHCELGIDALFQYQKKPMEGIVGPLGEVLYTNDHEHNWACHPADALRTGVMGQALTQLRHDRGQPMAPALAIY